MEQKMEDAFEYAIEKGNIELFDVLAKDFDNLSLDDKNFLLVRTIVNAPNTDFIQHVLDYGYDIHYRDEDGQTLLHFAAISDYPKTVRFFINKGLDKEAKDNKGLTPLFIAAEFGNSVDVLKTLIELGCDENVCDNTGKTLLITAAGRNKNPEITKFLIKRGYNIEARDEDGFTPLLNAAKWQENVEVLDILIDAGANINAKANNGNTLFHNAAYNESCEVVQYISYIFMTSDMNNSHESCLDLALIHAKSPDVLKIYLREMKIKHLLLAAYNENVEILETLIHSGYDVNTMDFNGMTIPMFVAKVNTNPKLIQSLMYYRGNINTKDNSGRTILHYAASNTDPTIYNWMLERDEFKKFIDEADEEGNKPAFYKKHPDKF